MRNASGQLDTPTAVANWSRHMLKSFGKVLLGAVALVAVLALLVHWITPAVLAQGRRRHGASTISSISLAAWPSACSTSSPR